MPLSKGELDAIRAGLNKLSAAAASEWQAVWDSLIAAERMEFTTELLAAWNEILDHHGTLSATLGEDMFIAQAEDLGIAPVTDTAPAWNADQARERLGWALSTTDQLANSKGVLDELVKAPYRHTIARSAVASQAGWARVPNGPTCPLCTVAASRGAIYSEATAAQKYHPHCDCTAVLVRGPEDYPAGYRPDECLAEYQSAAAVVGTDINDVCAEMSRQRAAARTGQEQAASRAALRARQSALGPAADPARVGWLQPGEIHTLERLQQLAPDVPLEDRLEWLPQGERIGGRTQPSHDIRWKERGGLLLEVKTPESADATTIKKRVWKAAKRSWDSHNYVKANFLVDIGDSPLTDGLRHELALINEEAQHRKVSRLFVLHQGQLDEVAIQ